MRQRCPVSSDWYSDARKVPSSLSHSLSVWPLSIFFHLLFYFFIFRLLYVLRDTVYIYIFFFLYFIFSLFPNTEESLLCCACSHHRRSPPLFRCTSTTMVPGCRACLSMPVWYQSDRNQTGNIQCVRCSYTSPASRSRKRERTSQREKYHLYQSPTDGRHHPKKSCTHTKKIKFDLNKK